MKLGKKTLIVIAAGAFIIIAASLGMVCSRQVSEQNQLNDELALVQLNLKRVQLEPLSSRQAELERQLSQATSQFEVVKAVLSQPVGSVAATTILFDTAKAQGVEVAKMTSPGPATESLEGATCSVISLTANVEGDVPNLVSFVTKLNSYLTTGVVKSAVITIPEETTNGEKVSAEIHLVVYTYQGD